MSMTSDTRTLILGTAAWPFGALEAPFIEPELEHVASAFDRVLVVPQVRVGERRETSARLQVKEVLLSSRKSGRLRAALHDVMRAGRSPLALREAIARGVTFHSNRAARRCIYHAARAFEVSSALEALLRYLEPRNTLVYSF